MLIPMPLQRMLIQASAKLKEKDRENKKKKDRGADKGKFKRRKKDKGAKEKFRRNRGVERFVRKLKESSIKGNLRESADDKTEEIKDYKKRKRKRGGVG